MHLQQRQVKYYDRLNKLQIAPSLKGNLKKIEKGDCLVAFSRKDIFNYRHAIENAGKHRCCVVYGKVRSCCYVGRVPCISLLPLLVAALLLGQLPSEIRVAQARLFNSSDSQYEVLVGSDAIGLGLNLNIRRIVFTTMEKYHIDSVSQLPVSLVSASQRHSALQVFFYPHNLAFPLTDLFTFSTGFCFFTPGKTNCRQGWSGQ